MSRDNGLIYGKYVASTLAVIAGGVAIYFIGVKSGQSKARMNLKIKLEANKVKDVVDIEDIMETKSYCRCWKSEKWPYCDGLHKKHNKETGDNTGPLVVRVLKNKQIE